MNMGLKHFLISLSTFLLFFAISFKAAPFVLDTGQTIDLYPDRPVSFPLDSNVIQAYAYKEGDLMRVGKGHIEKNASSIAVKLYPDIDIEPDDYNQGFFLESDILTLWQFQSASDKAKIRQIGQEFLSQIQAGLSTLMQSPVYKEKYQPQLLAIVREAGVQTLGDPRVREAFEKAILNLGDSLSRYAMSALPEVIADISADLVRELSKEILAFLFIGRTPDNELMHEIFSKFVNHPKIQEAIEQAFEEFLSSEGASLLSETLTNVFISNLSSDPRLFTLIEEAFSDPEMLEYIKPLANRSVNFLKAVIQILFTTDKGRRLDPFATNVLKSMIFHRESSFILLTGKKLFTDLSESNFILLNPEKGK